jgi:hypothetical protein
MTATTYTITDHEGSVRERGLGLNEAAITVMQNDGHEFEIRAEDDGEGYRLWTSRFSRNSPMGAKLVKSVIFSLAADEDAAAAEIYAEVIANADWFMGQTVQTDAAYDAVMAEFETAWPEH